MITGEIKNKVDKIWTDIWAGGMTNPLTVIEQLTYLMFIRSLDEKELENEQLEALTGKSVQSIFPQDDIGQSMRWSKFKHLDARAIYDIVANRVFPFIKNMNGGAKGDTGLIASSSSSVSSGRSSSNSRASFGVMIGPPAACTALAMSTA